MFLEKRSNEHQEILRLQLSDTILRLFQSLALNWIQNTFLTHIVNKDLSNFDRHEFGNPKQRKSKYYKIFWRILYDEMFRNEFCLRELTWINKVQYSCFRFVKWSDAIHFMESISKILLTATIGAKNVPCYLFGNRGFVKSQFDHIEHWKSVRN